MENLLKINNVDEFILNNNNKKETINIDKNDNKKETIIWHN